MATMLIVEGDSFMAQHLQRQFTHLGHTVLACASSAQEAIAHVQMHRPAVVLMNLHLPGEIDGLAAAHAMQAIYDVRVIYFMGETSAQLTEYTGPPVLWYYDGEPMNLEALHGILALTTESGQRPLRPPVPMGRKQSTAIWRAPRVLLERLEQVPQQAGKAYQQVVRLWGKAKGAAPSLPAAYTHALDGLAIWPAVGSCGTAAWRKEAVIVEDIATDPLWAGYRDLALRHGLRACWSVPILSAAGRVLGTFAMYYPRPHAPSAGEQHLVDLVAHTAAIAIERHRAERELRAALREKEVLLQEIHHRVKNNLQVVASLLDLQAEVVADPRVRIALEDSQARLQAIALIHEQLSQGASLTRLDAANYLRRLSTRLFETYSPSDGRITLELEVEEIALDVNVAIPCGLMLNELLSNALKHAFPGGRSGTVIITLRQEPPGTCMLTVRDTGVGLPEGLDMRQTDSLGLQLVSRLIEQLGGILTLVRGGGITFKLTFPLPQL